MEVLLLVRGLRAAQIVHGATQYVGLTAEHEQAKHRGIPDVRRRKEIAYADSSVGREGHSRWRPNGERFSCSDPAGGSTIAIGSAAWLLGGRRGGEPRPRSADSYKRLLGLCRSEPEPSTDPRGCHPAGPGETRLAVTFALPARMGPAPRGPRGPNMHGAFAAGGASTELTTERSPTPNHREQTIPMRGSDLTVGALAAADGPAADQT